MGVLLSIVSVGFSMLFTPLLMMLLSVIFLASMGKSLGVRRLYIKLLLALFEYGRQNIEHVKKRNGTWEVDGGDSEDEGSESPTNPKSNKEPTDKEKKSQNGSLGNSVIARSTDLVLVPIDQTTQNNEKIVEEPKSDTKEIEPIKNERVTQLSASKETDISRKKSFETLKREFEPAICLDYIRAGIESIIEDDVTSRFEAEELKNWNLLTRTNRRYEFISWKLTVIWVCGFFMRYCFLLPLRIFICFVGVMWLTFCTAIVGYMPDSEFKRWLNQRVLIMCFAVLSSALSSVITYHNVENKPKTGICVANHTSPIDALVLMCHNCYSLIGQRHGGFLGILQRALARASPHIWFERSEIKDREAVAKRLKLHISDPKNPPILIFPEGTCINNTSVMQFKKGSFEVGGVIYPVAIKYDPRFGDAFWNSSKYSMIQYLYMMMSSWAIVCDVWYLPPMYRKEDESAIDFANRVKSVIARQGGLVDLQWDGQLKRMKPKKEWREKQQEEFSRRLKVE
uniref:Phospholipid/glycerol acyltransferase domain-containing protein n=1 Tax=Trichogramma kaykai TaxID=54128 RepID=A0ABD2X4F6_9HYME